MSFANLKNNKRANIGKLVAAAEKVGGDKKSYGDDRFWKPTVDKVGNGYAVIRFLPAASDNDLPWVRYWDHGFQGPTGQWYIEKSLTSVDLPDPVSELNSQLWNTGLDDDKETARKQKRRLHYVSNIKVISDPSNPDNEGKTFLYQYGKKIFDKIMDAMAPEFDDEEALDPFNFWEGANFKLKIRKVEGWTNYDKSEFGKKEALSDDDAVLEKVYDNLIDLREFTDPTKSYKSYEDLKAKLNRVLNIGEDSRSAARREDTDQHREEPKSMKETGPSLKSPHSDDDDGSSTSSEDDDSLSYFKSLAEGD